MRWLDESCITHFSSSISVAVKEPDKNIATVTKVILIEVAEKVIEVPVYRYMCNFPLSSSKRECRTSIPV